MAKFTKLSIGDIVASSGGRVWRKLNAERKKVHYELEGTWILNTELVDVDYPYPDAYGFTLADISSVKVNYDAPDKVENATYKRFYMSQPDANGPKSYKRLAFYNYLDGESVTFYTNFGFASIISGRCEIYTSSRLPSSETATVMVDLDKLSEAHRTVTIQNIQDEKKGQGYQNILAWFNANATKQEVVEPEEPIGSYTVTNSCGTYASQFTIKVNDTTLENGVSAKVMPGDIVTVSSISSPSSEIFINGLGTQEDITTLTYSEDITFTTKKINYATTANFTINFQTTKPDYTVSGTWLMNETLTLPTAFEGKIIRAIFVASPDATSTDDDSWDYWNGESAELGFVFFSNSRPMHYPGLGYLWDEDEGSFYAGDVYVSPTATGTTQYKGWRHTGYRKITFLGDQTLSATGYNWFTENATKIA